VDTILVVDDDRHIAELASLYLSSEGYAVIQAQDGAEALKLSQQRSPDLLLLDIMLPKLDGWEVCRRLRRAGNEVPIIMLTARSDDVDRIVGLELGADDYVVKPFNPRELVARVKAVLRRSEGKAPSEKVLRVGRLEIYPERREARVSGKELGLRAKEFDLLLALAERPGFVFSREQLLEHVWGFDFAGQTRTVDVHVARLRDKLTDSGAVITTVWNVGYKLVEE
jgi:two-component system alkaline phosphatase synthesis response regulator PhoP